MSRDEAYLMEILFMAKDATRFIGGDCQKLNLLLISKRSMQ